MWINLFFLFQPVNKLKMRYEEPSFLLTSKNLATYSQTVKSKFPTRESFGEEIAKYFDMGLSKAKTDYWACTPEPHKEGGEHYHFSIKLSGTKSSLGVKNHLYTKHKISVNFSVKHDNYYTAFKYISKSDENVYTSQGHPYLKEIVSLQTKQCINAYRKKSKEKKGAANNEQNNNKVNKKVKRKSLTDYLIWMYQSLWSKIISKVKLSSLQLLMNRKRQGKKILQI